MTWELKQRLTSWSWRYSPSTWTTPTKSHRYSPVKSQRMTAISSAVKNRNSVELYGLEGGVYWAAMDDLRLFAVVNYTHGEEQSDVGPAFPADRIPPVNGKLGLEYFFKADWRFEPYFLFASSQDRLSPGDVRDPRINPSGTSGWATLNLSLDWQTTASLQIGLRLENLADKVYREHASGIDAAGRNIGLWMNYSFP